MSLSLLGVGNSGGGAASNGLLTDLLSYYKFEETSGTRTDSHGDRPFDVVTNAPGVGTGIKDNAIALVRASDQWVGNNDASKWTEFNGSAVAAFSLWASKTGNSTQWLFRSENGGSGWLSVSITNSAGAANFKVEVDPSSSWVATTNSPFPASGLAHICASYDGTQPSGVGRVRIWVNGTEVGTGDKSMAGTVPAALDATIAGKVSVGSYSGAAYDGLVDEFAIWNRVLTPDDVALLYNSGTGLFYGDFS